MSPPFFITGLPRSRTAWLANLFTTDKTICFHEPFGALALKAKLHAPKRVGAASSAMVLEWENLVREFPDSPWLYVEREPDQAFCSFMRWTSAHQAPVTVDQVRAIWKQHEAKSTRLKREAQVHVLLYEQLDCLGPMNRAWKHLLPGVEFDEYRWRMLKDLRIEQIYERRAKEFGLWV